MAKNKNKKIEKNIKKDIEKKEVSTEVKQLLAITVAVLLFLGLFYFLTVLAVTDLYVSAHTTFPFSILYALTANL